MKYRCLICGRMSNGPRCSDEFCNSIAVRQYSTGDEAEAAGREAYEEIAREDYEASYLSMAERCPPRE